MTSASMSRSKGTKCRSQNSCCSVSGKLTSAAAISDVTCVAEAEVCPCRRSPDCRRPPQSSPRCCSLLCRRKTTSSAPPAPSGKYFRPCEAESCSATAGSLTTAGPSPRQADTDADADDLDLVSASVGRLPTVSDKNFAATASRLRGHVRLKGVSVESSSSDRNQKKEIEWKRLRVFLLDPIK